MAGDDERSTIDASLLIQYFRTSRKSPKSSKAKQVLLTPLSYLQSTRTREATRQPKPDQTPMQANARYPAARVRTAARRSHWDPGASAVQAPVPLWIWGTSALAIGHVPAQVWHLLRRAEAKHRRGKAPAFGPALVQWLLLALPLLPLSPHGQNARGVTLTWSWHWAWANAAPWTLGMELSDLFGH